MRWSLHPVSDNVLTSRRKRTEPAEPFFLAALAAKTDKTKICRVALVFVTPARLQEAAYARDPLGGLMRRPTRLAGGCGQKQPHTLLTEPCTCLLFMQMRCYAPSKAPLFRVKQDVAPLNLQSHSNVHTFKHCDVNTF
jgi:hypothetical protein